MQGQAAAVSQLVALVIQERMKTKVGRQTYTIADRLAALCKAVDDYAAANRDELLAGERGKSRKFTHGVIGWKVSPERLEFYVGQDAGKVAATLVAEFGLDVAVRSLLEQCELTEGTTAADVLNVVIGLDLKAIRARHGKKLLDAETRQRLKLKVAGGDERFERKANPPKVQDENE